MIHSLNASQIGSHAIQAQAAGLSWIQIVMLAINFGQKYGPELLTIVTQVALDVRAGNVAAIAALVVQYGPDIEAMANTIAGWFGITLPTLPTT